MGKGIVKLGEGKWAVKDGNLLAAKETNGRFKNTEFTVSRGTRASYVGRDGLIKESNLQDVNLVNNGDFSELGSELVTNGTFDTDSDWSTIGTWDIVNNQAEAIGNGISQYIQQDFTISNGNIYKFTYEIIENTLNGNGASLSSSGGFGSVSISNVVGTHTEYITASNDTATYALKIGVSGTATSGTIKLDNVSVKEVDPNDYWVANTGWSIEDGEGVADNSSSYIKQNNVIDNNKTFKIQFDTVVTSGQFRLVATADAATYTSYVTESGSYTFYMKPTVSINGGLEFVASSFTGTIDNLVVNEVKTDTPRIDFTDNTDGHLLLEPQSTNLVTYSEDFSEWTLGSNSTLTYESDVVAPDGSLGVYRLTNPATSSTFIQSPLFTYNNPITLSIYAKYADASNNEFDLYDGTNTTKKITTSEWQRFDAVGFGNQLTIVNHGDAYITDIYIWGGQAEAIGYPTSYIPTNGSTVTRDADTCTGAGDAIDFNSEEGVLYAEINALSYPTDINSWLTITDGTANNSVGIVFENTPYITGRVDVGGVNQAYLANNVDYSDFVKVALKYKANDFALWINGTEVVTDTSGNTFSANTLNSLQFSYGGGTNNWKGKVKTIRVYKEALSDTDLENLTS